MSYENARYRNFGNDEGDVLNFFNNQLRNLVQKNGGDNSFATYTEDFHDKNPKNLMVGEKTKLMLTHPNHTISQIEKSFIEMEVEFEVGFENELVFDYLTGLDDNNDPIYIDQAGILQIFVGFKDAVEIISECRFYVDGKLINEYLQNEMIRESYAYNTIRSKEVKKASSNAHSLWEDVINFSPNVCGVYIPLNKFYDLENQNCKNVKVNMHLNIPFTDQLALQAWRLYPNRILGEMEEEIKTSLDALVWCMVPPQNVAKILKTTYYDPFFEYNVPLIPFTNNFTQIGEEAVIVDYIHYNGLDNYDSSLFYNCESSIFNEDEKKFYRVDYGIGQYKLIVNHGFKPKIKIGRTHCFGFGIKPEVIEGLLNSLQQPIIIPAQELTRYVFEQKPTEKEINVRKFIPLRNATNITMMFPTSVNNCTIYKNINYRNVQLRVDKRLYPHLAYDSTTNGVFVQSQLMANELDGTEATPELIESLSKSLNHKLYDDSIVRVLNSSYDNTNFSINFQLERGNSGYVFDGLDTGSKDVEIEFRAYPIVDGTLNTYIYPNQDYLGAVSDLFPPYIPNPEMWICSDTYWTWSIENGVEYHHEGIPDGYE